MYSVEAMIEGVAPVLFNRRVRSPDDKSPTPNTVALQMEEAREKVYRDAEGLFWPGWNLKKAISEGAKRADLKLKRASLGTLLLASVFIDPEPRFGQSDLTIHEVLGRIPPRTGSQVIIRRPMLAPGWTLRFRATVLDDRHVPDLLRMAVESAGLAVGIGSWRPEYGRFVLREWNVTR